MKIKPVMMLIIINYINICLMNELFFFQLQSDKFTIVQILISLFAVASMADKTRGRMRILSYGDANRHRRDLLELATAGFMRLVQVDSMKISEGIVSIFWSHICLDGCSWDLANTHVLTNCFH